jgi:hypothetical protein
MQAYAARTSLECTSKTCRYQAHALLHTASACRVFFERHHTRLPLLVSTMDKGSSVCTRENSPPARDEVKAHGEFPLQDTGCREQHMTT